MSNGTVKGIALAPGVSRNGRLYTREAIAKAAARMQARIADPNGSPIVMRTHHAAGDDSTRIVAQVRKVTLDQAGALHYESGFAGTAHAQTIRELAKPTKDGDKPNLAHVSIYGWWTDDPTTKVLEDGTKVETADDFEIDAIDFTSSPGVLAATATAETRRHAHAITESLEAEITVTETGTVEIEPAPARYADPGYLGEKRWPIDTASETVAAWARINTGKHGLTEAQTRRVRTRIKSAAKKTGATIEDNWVVSGAPADAKLSEYYTDYYGDIEAGTPPATFCFDATNGPIRVSISSYCIDPADLEIVTMAAIKAANDALKAMDPDMDGDIDLPGVEDTDDDGDQMETTTPGSSVLTETATEVASTEKESPMADNAAENTQGAATKAAPVTESATPAPVAIDESKLAETIIAIMEQRDAAKAKQAEESAANEAAAAETEKAKAEEAANVKANLAEMVKDSVRGLLAEGTVTASRKGYAHVEEKDAIDRDELWEKRGELFLGAAREARELGIQNR